MINSRLREKQNRVCYNWGFQFALWCSILWGISYQFLEILITRDTFSQLKKAAGYPYAQGAALSAVLTAMITLISMIWLLFTGEIREIRRAALASPKLSRNFLVQAVTGGLAAWATYVTAGLSNTVFAVSGVMFYPLLGALIARKYLSERIPSKIRGGMLMICAGWALFYFPPVMRSTWGQNTWVGGMLGLLTGIGWAVEGVTASGTSDLIDTDTCVAVRYLYECVLWAVFLLPLGLFRPECLLWQSVRHLLRDPYSMGILFLIALCLCFNYFSWYRSFTLMGVTEGLVISNVSGFATVLTGMLLAISMPSWTETAASSIMIFGIFQVYWNGISSTGIYRGVNLAPVLSPPFSPDSPEKNPAAPLKARLLLLIAAKGPLWDFEAADLLIRHIPSPRARQRNRNRLRTCMIEARAAGLLTSVEEAIDETPYFQTGKLLSCYQLTAYGYERLAQNRLLHPEEQPAERTENP